MQEVQLGVTCDMHVHLREGDMCELVTPAVREGGVSVAYIMPNLQPPVTTLKKAIAYKQHLKTLAPATTFLMSFYLTKELTPELIHEAARMKVVNGVKCYPAGVTTNSAAGVDPNDFSDFYPIFKAMEEEGLVLNLHGEKPSIVGEDEDIHVLNAEACFLPALRRIHDAFPKLKIVLEHCTTAAAVALITELNRDVTDPSDVTVAASLTAHHLYLSIDDWAGNPVNFCKPVAKLPSDRRALVSAATSGKPYFFFGSDSAPHPLENKAQHVNVCAGVYSQSHSIAYLAQIFAENNALDKLRDFVSTFPLKFYGVKEDTLESKDEVIVYKKTQYVPETIQNDQGLVIAPFMAGKPLDWCVKWVHK